MPGSPRRALFTLAFLLVSCGRDRPPPRPRRDFPPLRYGYLPPINLNVQRVEMAEGFVPSSGDAEISGDSPVNFAETLFAMARDRLKPVATSGVATFHILTASMVRRRETLNGVLAVRLSVRNADDTSTGYAEARVTAAHTGPISNQSAAIYDMLKSLMDELNVEFEFQVRNQLRGWVGEPPAEPVAPAPPPVKGTPSAGQESG